MEEKVKDNLHNKAMDVLLYDSPLPPIEILTPIGDYLSGRERRRKRREKERKDGKKHK